MMMMRTKDELDRIFTCIVFIIVMNLLSEKSLHMLHKIHVSYHLLIDLNASFKHE